MSRLFKKSNATKSDAGKTGFIDRLKFAFVLVTVTLMLATTRTGAFAQVPSVFRLQDTKQTSVQEEPARTLEMWRTDIIQRLKETETLLKSEGEEENKPDSTVKRQLEILTRIDLTLSQLAEEKSQTEKINKDREKIQKELKQVVDHGLPVGEAKSFRRLDELRDELRSEQRRLERLVEKEQVAVAAFENAQEDRQAQSGERRLAREKLAENQEDKQRQILSEDLAEAEWLSELTEAVAQLRLQEVENAKATTKLHELRIKLLEEKEARLGALAKFGQAELNELWAEIDRQEDDLRKEIASVEGAATQLRYLDEQWARAQRQLDASTGDKEVLREEIAAYQLGRQNLQQRKPLLSWQLDRIKDVRRVWQRRQQVFSARPSREDIRTWKEESTESLIELRREERREIFEIEELREKLRPLEDREKKVERGSPEEYWIGQQIESLRALLQGRQSNLSSIRASQQLHEKLLDELSGDSLAATAGDRISDLWHGVQSIWQFELTSFGEGAEEQSVTVQKVVTALLIFLAGLIFSKALSRALGRQVLRRLDIDASASATIQSLFYYLLLLMFSLFALKVARVPLTAFTVLGGAVALGIGFGSQNIINNFISGLILLAERPVKVGDLIQLDNLNGAGTVYGNIEHIGARSTRVRTGSNLEIIVPNSSFLQNNVVNFTLSNDKVRAMVEVGVIYGSPTVTVTQLLRRAVIETGRVAKDPPPIILFKSFGDSSLVFEVHFWIRMRTMMDQLQVESAVRFRIDQLFREEGITIAFPQQDVHLDTSSPLTIQMVESPPQPT